MSRDELSDNLIFLSAVQMLRHLTEDNVLTQAEAEIVRRLRTII